MSTLEQRQQRIATIREFPARLEALLTGLTDAQLNAQTLPNEWSVRQIVHHLADSHLNSVLRFKLILTSDNPTLQGYDQAAWALLPDVDAVPLEASLHILQGLHARWVVLFEYAAAHDLWHKSGQHTESGPMSIAAMLDIYARHCDEHIAQIRRVLAAG